MSIDRRAVLAGGAAVLALRGSPVAAATAAERLASEVALFAEGAAVEAIPFGLTIDPYVESGYTVPVRIAAAAALPGDRVVLVRLLAPDNPLLRVATFRWGAMATGTFATRIRLARSQTVVALARTAAGRVLRQETRVEVVVGGCGFDVEERAG